MLRTTMFLLSWLMVGGPVSPQELAAGTCGEAEPAALEGDDLGAPRVRGRSFEVPALRLDFSNDGSDSELPGSRVFVCYDWKWYRYPYSERLFGGWDVRSECRSCNLDSAGGLAVQSHQVTPRGWYNGWLLFGRKPRFAGVRFALDSGPHSYSFSLEPREIEFLKTGRVSDREFESGPIRLTVQRLKAGGD